MTKEAEIDLLTHAHALFRDALARYDEAIALLPTRVWAHGPIHSRPRNDITAWLTHCDERLHHLGVSLHANEVPNGTSSETIP